MWEERKKISQCDYYSHHKKIIRWNKYNGVELKFIASLATANIGIKLKILVDETKFRSNSLSILVN